MFIQLILLESLLSADFSLAALGHIGEQSRREHQGHLLEASC